MLTHIIPARRFAVATTAPTMLASASDVLAWFGQHPGALTAIVTTVVTAAATAGLLLLIAWAFRRELSRATARSGRSAAPVIVLDEARETFTVIPAPRGER